ncbi:MAG TPA: bifunctional DNA-binding transcriptional regulator/O6-methylguanine-DNA methyltransferase Ada [Xanthomonadaceae bacterium]|nr:bifunctional DNA-binding transcriptional regulator/O6-methylguanine-DNA methyltransferase Ada [Xanthomonadaceae bacterium]
MDEQAMWQAVCGRDARADAAFRYGVITTGVYCRPSCPSRRPRREHVRFFADAAAARAAGFRACRRCRPDNTDANDPVARMQALCRHIEAHAEQNLRLEELARVAGLSPSRLQRVFKAAIGVSPRQYLESVRLGRFKGALREGARVTTAIHEAGFGSASRLYERVDTRLGMTPQQYRARGKGVTISFAVAPTPLGPAMLGATDRGLCYLQFGDDQDQLLAQLRAEYPQATIERSPAEADAPFADWVAALAAHLAGTAPRPELPLDIRGTAFQMRVWSFLQSIPSGQVRAYAEVAEAIGAPRAARAVAGACAANRIAVLIPCHRVVRGDGGLGGYRWGLARKRTLIDLERRERS